MIWCCSCPSFSCLVFSFSGKCYCSVTGDECDSIIIVVEKLKLAVTIIFVVHGARYQFDNFTI